MKEHPIPQDITGYRFHIVGNMTIKQFAEIGGGFLLAAILYKVGFPPYIKYPLMVLSAGVGAAMAFLPIEERPLDHWIVTFVQVLFRPTQFYWRRSATIPSYFLFEPSRDLTPNDEVDLSPARRERIHQFISSLNEGEAEVQELGSDDSLRLSSILDTFNDESLNQLLPVTTQATVTKPNLVVRVRQLREDKEAGEVDVVPDQALAANSQPIQNPNDAGWNIQPQFATDIVEPPSQLQSSNLSASSKAPVAIPTSELTAVIRSEQVDQNQAEPTIDPSQTQPESSEAVPLILTTPTQSPIKDSVDAQSGVYFNANLPFPSTPTEPNKLVGMVLSAQGDMVPGAIIEVVDQNDNLARAVKSNALGQFFITTPLITGTYVIKVDKDELQFAPQELVVNNSILQPIELRAIAWRPTTQSLNLQFSLATSNNNFTPEELQPSHPPPNLVCYKGSALCLKPRLPAPSSSWTFMMWPTTS